MRVYIGGPITLGHMIDNIRTAIQAATVIRDLGHAPYVPHLSLLWDLVCPRPYEDWLALDLEWLAVCDCLVRLPGESPGADREVAEARRLGLPVYEGVEAFVGRVGVAARG